MGGGAEADVGDASPVGAVVDRFAAGERPVGDLVMDVTGLGEHPAEGVVLAAALLVRGLGVAARRDHFLEGTAFLDGQLVC